MNTIKGFFAGACTAYGVDILAHHHDLKAATWWWALAMLALFTVKRNHRMLDRMINRIEGGE